VSVNYSAVSAKCSMPCRSADDVSSSDTTTAGSVDDPPLLRGPDDPDFLVGLNLSSSLNAAVERQLSFEAPYDVAEYVRIVRERIGVEGRHNAAVPKVLNGNHRVADQKVLAFPCSLFKTGDVANNNVRPKSSPVSSELRDRAVGRHQQRKYVEAIQAVVTNQPRTRTYNLLNAAKDIRISPRTAVN
jgi:hypothetical protein